MYGFRERAGTLGHLGQQRWWSREENAGYFLNLLCLSVPSEDSNGVYTPCTVHITARIQEHMQDGGGLGVDEWNFPVFLTAFDFNTTASLTPTVSRIFPVLWACRSLEGKMGITFQIIHIQQLQLQFLFLPNQRTELLVLANRDIFITTVGLYFPSYFTHFILRK